MRPPWRDGSAALVVTTQRRGHDVAGFPFYLDRPVGLAPGFRAFRLRVNMPTGPAPGFPGRPLTGLGPANGSQKEENPLFLKLPRRSPAGRRDAFQGAALSGLHPCSCLFIETFVL